MPGGANVAFFGVFKPNKNPYYRGALFSLSLDQVLHMDHCQVAELHGELFAGELESMPKAQDHSAS
jgi:hypothetical protein